MTGTAISLNSSSTWVKPQADGLARLAARGTKLGPCGIWAPRYLNLGMTADLLMLTNELYVAFSHDPGFWGGATIEHVLDDIAEGAKESVSFQNACASWLSESRAAFLVNPVETSLLRSNRGLDRFERMMRAAYPVLRYDTKLGTEGCGLAFSVFSQDSRKSGGLCARQRWRRMFRIASRAGYGTVLIQDSAAAYGVRSDRSHRAWLLACASSAVAETVRPVFILEAFSTVAGEPRAYEHGFSDGLAGRMLRQRDAICATYQHLAFPPSDWAIITWDMASHLRSERDGDAAAGLQFLA